MSWVNFVTLAALIIEVQSQLCGCGAPGQIQGPQINAPFPPSYPCSQPNNLIYQQPCLPQQPIISPSQPVIAQSTCPSQPLCQCQPIVAAAPVVAATIIDNSVSNALANAIQLLIVSNLIENTMNCGIISPDIYPIVDCITSNDMDCSDVIELPNICQYDAISCTCPITEVCQTFAPPVTNYVTPHQTVPRQTLSCQTLPCQTLPCQTFPCQTLPPVECCADFLNPIPQGPVAAEVYFPSAIPAQLTCNFGYTPTNVPCVSVNVEPLPMFDTCGSNIFGNGFYSL